MVRFIPVESFPKRGNTFGGISFVSFYRNSRKFLYHSSTLTSARLLMVILPRKNAKDLKDGSHLGEEDCVPKERLRRRLERWR